MKEFNLFSLKGKVIVVVGATAGLGMHFVEAFAAAGADLALIDIPVSEAKLAEFAKRIGEEYQVKTKHYTLDTGNEAEVAAKSDAVVNDFGKIDGLLNTAGINHYGTVDEYTEEAYNRLLAVNVSGTFGCCKHFGRKMRDQGHGSIVNIASVSGTICNRAPGPRLRILRLQSRCDPYDPRYRGGIRRGQCPCEFDLPWLDGAENVLLQRKPSLQCGVQPPDHGRRYPNKALLQGG